MALAAEEGSNSRRDEHNQRGHGHGNLVGDIFEE
jgi:hypothetical protein